MEKISATSASDKFFVIVNHFLFLSSAVVCLCWANANANEFGRCYFVFPFKHFVLCVRAAAFLLYLFLTKMYKNLHKDGLPAPPSPSPIAPPGPSLPPQRNEGVLAVRQHITSTTPARTYKPRAAAHPASPAHPSHREEHRLHEPVN